MSVPSLPASIRFIQRDWLSCNQIIGFDGQAGNRHATLIDTGYGKHAAQTLALVTHVLGGEGLPIGALRHILNTHLHSDHCGGNALLARISGARVRVPQAEFDTVCLWDETRLTFRGTGQRCERFCADGAITPGEHLRLGGLDWQALAAPGHDPHSLILHCPDEQLLISADALWENGFGIIFPELSGDSGFREQHDVLELIASLPVRTVLPGHGRVFHDVPDALQRARGRLAALRADPRRNARNSIKALIKFLMLEFEQLPMTGLIDTTTGATIMRGAADQLGMTLAQALQWAADDLLAQGQLGRAANGDLLNAEPAGA